MAKVKGRGTTMTATCSRLEQRGSRMTSNTSQGGGAGHHASSPWAIPVRGWRDIALRAWKEGGQDNISLVASGVAFCGVLALVPMLGAVVLSYGLIATPETVMKNVQSLTSVMPTEPISGSQ